MWGSGVLEFDCKKDREQQGDPWKVYLDPDGEMEIDLYRDDGIIHVITTGVSPVDDVLWVSSTSAAAATTAATGAGFYAHETGLPSDFTNNVKARSANECWFAHDKGAGRGRRFPDRDRGGLHARSEDAPRQGPDLPVGQAAEDRRHGEGRAAELHHLHRPRRQRHLGGDRQRARLGDRRRILRRPEVESGVARRKRRKLRPSR